MRLARDVADVADVADEANVADEAEKARSGHSPEDWSNLAARGGEPGLALRTSHGHESTAWPRGRGASCVFGTHGGRLHGFDLAA